jgi:hypothetical protein
MSNQSVSIELGISISLEKPEEFRVDIRDNSYIQQILYIRENY